VVLRIIIRDSGSQRWFTDGSRHTSCGALCYMLILETL
jgi:hypothetical protein